MRLLLISTGGTIAMTEGRETFSSSIESKAADFAEMLSLSSSDEVRVLDFSQIPSSNFNSDRAAALTQEIEKHRNEVDAACITHGTDTLEETTFYLEMVLDRGRPVVLTGAMKSANEAGYDGIANLKDSVTVALSPDSFNKGVLVVMNKDIISGLHCIKQESERSNAFGSVQTGKFGSVNGSRVLYYYEPKDHLKLKNKTAGRVALVKLHYDIQAEFLNSALGSSDAIVLECLGSGRIQPHLILIIKRWSNQKLIIITTRASSGHLFDAYEYDGSYHRMVKERVIMSSLNSLKSCILVRLCLGNSMDFNQTKRVFEDFWKGHSIEG